jgi:hypothetical protein
MMANDKYKDPFVAVSTAILILTAMGVIIFTKVPLKGLRPVTEVQEPTEKVRARLWQDPFATVLGYIQSQPKGIILPEPDLCPLIGAQNLQIQESVKKGSLPQTIANFGDQGKVTILGVMVFGGPYSEDTEFRIRQRVAVLSALRRFNYVPEDAEHLNFLRIQTSAKLANSSILLSNIMPYEWLEKTSSQQQDRILLLWLNDDSFQPNPLERLNCLIKYLRSAEPARQLSVKIIGPAGSSNLFNMINETKQSAASFQFPSDMAIYSPTATVSNTLLLEKQTNGMALADAAQVPGLEEQLGKEIQRFFEGKGIKFVRTITTDRQLAKTLIEELQNRGVDLLLRGKSGREGHDHSQKDEKVNPYGGHRGHLVLIAEWDTFYGRSLPEIFVQEIRQEHNAGLTPDNISFLPPERQVSWVHRYSYLRGLDGVVPGSKDLQEPRPRGGSGKDEAEKLIQEEPLGRSQLDYLRRLANHIYQLDQSLSQEDRGSIRAVGILGSDFYDKYLVLQALKQRFPEAIFFTTDLDARLMFEEYSDWTRNLVVASGFDLNLPSEVQGDVPPFRSSYQTSVFYAVLQALCAQETSMVCAALTGKPLSYPHLFEIGRQSAIDLQEKGQAPVSLLKVIAFVIIVLIFLWVISRGFRTGHEAQWRKGLLLALVAFLILLYYLFQRVILASPSEEPFSLTAGISVWPTELIRLVALCCSGYFFIKAAENLRQNDRELAGEFDFRPFVRTSNGDYHPRYTIGSLWATLMNYFWFWSPKEAVARNFNVNDRWENYQQRGTLGLQVLRVLGIMVLYLPLAGIVVRFFGPPHPPVRGPWSTTVDSRMLFLTVGSFLFLTFFVFDTTRLLRCFITEALGKEIVWDSTSAKQFLGEKGLAAEELDDWMLIRLIARRSEIVSQLIYYPFIIWFLLFASRWYNFDNWRTPIGLAIVISLSAVFTWSCALTLRHAAEKLRAQIIDRLSRKLISLYAAPNFDATRQNRIRGVIDEVKSIRQGAFTPFFQNPVIQALFVPFGGVGGLTLLDFLNKLS